MAYKCFTSPSFLKDISTGHGLLGVFLSAPKTLLHFPQPLEFQVSSPWPLCFSPTCPGPFLAASKGFSSLLVVRVFTVMCLLRDFVQLPYWGFVGLLNLYVCVPFHIWLFFQPLSLGILSQPHLLFLFWDSDGTDVRSLTWSSTFWMLWALYFFFTCFLVQWSILSLHLPLFLRSSWHHCPLPHSRSTFP